MAEIAVPRELFQEILRLIDDRDRPQRRTGTAGCIVAMGGLCLNAEEKGQIGGSNVVCDGGDDENAGSTAQARRCLPGNSAVCYRLRRSRVHLGNVG